MSDLLGNSQQARFFQSIADPLDEEDLLSNLFGFLSSEFGGVYFSLWLRDVTKRDAYALLVGEYGYDTRGVIHVYQRVPLGVGVVGRTIQSGKTLVLDLGKPSDASIPADKEFVLAEGFRSVLCVAASDGTEITGALLAARRDRNRWSKSETASLSYICGEAISALTRVSRRSENRILVRMLLNSHTWRETVTVLEEIASLLRDGFHSDICSINIRPARGSALYSYTSPKAGREHSVAGGREFTVAKGIMALGRSMRLFDVRDRDELAVYGMTPSRAIDLEGSHDSLTSGHVLGAPIVVSTLDDSPAKPLGAIILNRSVDRIAFLPHNEEAVSAIGMYLGILLERTQALQSMTDYFESFTQLSSSLILGDIHSMLAGLLEALASLSDSSIGYATLVASHDPNVLETIATIGDLPEQYQSERTLSEIESRAVKAGTALYLPTKQQRRKLEPTSIDNYESQLCIPVRKDDKVIGVVGVFSPYVHALSSREINFAEAYCAIAAVSIDSFGKKMLSEEKRLELLEIMASLNSATDLAQAYESLAYGAAELLDGDFSYIAVAEASECHLVGSAGMSEDEREVLNISPRLASVERLFSHGNVIVVENTNVDSDLAMLVPGQKPRSCILGSIAEDDQRMAFVLVSAAPGKYGASDSFYTELMQLLARYAAAAITMAKLRDEQDRVQQSIREQQSAILAGTLAFGISHQINTYMSRLSFSLQDIKELFDSLKTGSKITKSTKDEMAAFVDSNMGNILELNELNQKLLSVGSITAKREALDFNHVVRGYIDSLAKRMKKSNISWEFLPDPSLSWKDLSQAGTVVADAGQVGQVITILIENAIDSYLGKKGLVEISTRKCTLEQKEYAVIMVRDYGEGISSEDKVHVGDTFFSTKEGGHGFGLAMAHLITKGHGGKLEFDSEKWKGSEFRASFLIGEVR